MTPAPPARAALKRTSCHERPHAPGGAERKHTRVRGFAEWLLHRKTRALLVHVNAVLHE